MKGTSLLKYSGKSNCLIVRELGSGIYRGAMNYGRLYQSKYIPPDRTDGVPVWCQENEKSTIEEMKEKMAEDHYQLSITAEDFDLD